ncbi:galactose mutarotase [Aerococcaceae bacterium NML180378]|nr:galactose mutarotase [Aerococcaceae bacterium NML180378]
MKVEIQSFGVYNLEEFSEIFVTNDRGVQISFSDMGARINRWSLPNAEGGSENILLGHECAEDVANSLSYYGATVGRVAGRIGEGKFTLNDTLYELPINNGGNHLHGGPAAMDVQKWDYLIEEANSEVRVVFSYVDKAGTNGYPGTLEVKVIHTFNNENEWHIRYEASSDADTLFNPTNHVYFNLNGDNSATIDNHELQIDADYYLPLSEQTLPLGHQEEVTDSVFDLRQPVRFGEVRDSQHPQFILAKGYDHPFVLNKKAEHHAVISCPEKRRTIKMVTDCPTVVVYTHNYLPNIEQIWQRPILQNAGVTLETQIAPNAINQPQFGNIVLRKGDKFVSTTSYLVEYE